MRQITEVAPLDSSGLADCCQAHWLIHAPDLANTQVGDQITCPSDGVVMSVVEREDGQGIEWHGKDELWG
jgi:hypothetical protein